MLCEQRFECRRQLRQPLWKRRGDFGLDLPVGDVGKTIAISPDQSPAGRAEAGV
jgi:hypothetical protein